jgi:hypothetical protein
VAIDAHNNKSCHLGFGKSITRSNLSKANENCDSRIFEEYAYYLIDVARQKRSNNDFEIKGKVYAFDSITIDLCLSVFWWVPPFAMDVIPYEEGDYYIFDRGYVDYASKDYPKKLRKVAFYDKEMNRIFIYISNNFELSAEQIAMLYKNRWQIELFKWIKQHLKIQCFWGTTENAVRIQI